MSLTEKIFDFIGKWIIITLGILASVGSFTSMFEIVINVPVMILTTISVTGIFLAISKLKRKIKVTIILVMLFVMTVCIIIMRKMLLTGIYSIANAVIFKYNDYFPDGVIGFFEVEAVWAYDTLVLAIAVIIYSYILVTATWYKMFASIHILLSILFVVPGMILGMMPNSLFVSMLIIYYMLCFMYQHNRRVYPVRFMVLVTVSLIIIGLIFIFSPPSAYDAEAKYKNIYNKLNDISKKYNLDGFSKNNMKKVLGDNESVANGGINGGKLGDIGEVRYLEKTMLKVRVRSADDNVVYLKGFVGTEYDKAQWNPISYNNIRRYNMFCNEMELRGYDEVYCKGITVSPEIEVFADKDTRLMTIEYTNAEKEYRYLPYFSDILDRDDVDFYYGVRPVSNYQKQYDYLYVSLSEDDIYQCFDEYSQDGMLYEYIEETNLSVPKNLQSLFEKKGFEADCYDYTAESMIYCINQVRDYLADNTFYTLSPGKLDSGKDYVEDFLTNKKQGYCTAYASSAALMLRYMGIPARYVEGYIIRPSDYAYSDNQDGIFEADIKDNSAHAWVEVYVPGIGFAPIEMTPGYGTSTVNRENTDPTPESSKTHTGTTKPNATTTPATIDTGTQTTTPAAGKESSKEEVKTKRGNHGTQSKSGGMHAGLMIIIFASIIVIAAISLIVYRIAEMKKKRYDYGTPDIRHNIIVLGMIFERCLDRLKIDYSKNVGVRELEGEIDERIDNALSNNRKILRGDKEARDMVSGLRDITEVLEIINKSRYSDEASTFTDEEFEKVKDYVEEFKKSLQYLKNKV